MPSYRTGLFLDPKGRGMTTGYDQAQALAASQTGLDGQAELENEINKVFDVFDGTIEFAVSNVNAAEGEVGGVFVSSQASDTDLGSKTPKKVLSKGIFYGAGSRSTYRDDGCGQRGPNQKQNLHHTVGGRRGGAIDA